MRMRGVCSIEGCDGPHLGHGWCNMHYSRWRRKGDPNASVTAYGVMGRPTIPLAQRLWRYMRRTEDGCWEWTGGRIHDGYGKIKVGGRTCRTHRVAYELLVGPIPEGLTLDHLCRNRACFNPAHLEPVTIAENLKRKANK